MLHAISPVIVGLVTGIAFIVAFNILQLSEANYYDKLYGNESPIVEFYFTNLSLIVLDKHRIDDNEYNRQVIEIILTNATVAKVLEEKQWVIFGIGQTLFIWQLHNSKI